MRDDILVCRQCRRTVKRKDTLIIQDQKQKKEIRLCRDCQMAFYIDELKRVGVGGALQSGVKIWSKDIKNGALS